MARYQGNLWIFKIHFDIWVLNLLNLRVGGYARKWIVFILMIWISQISASVMALNFKCISQLKCKVWDYEKTSSIIMGNLKLKMYSTINFCHNWNKECPNSYLLPFIQKAKGTAAARKHASETLKAFFSDPENRQKRSIAMKGELMCSLNRQKWTVVLCFLSLCKYHALAVLLLFILPFFIWISTDFHLDDAGVRFYCKHCGREGHRKFYCPELKDGLTDRGFKCRLCGERGHNRRTCPKSRLSYHNGTVSKHHRCQICRQRGHNRRTCPQVTGEKRHDSNGQKHIPTSASKTCTCRFCGEKGHNIRTCPRRNLEQLKSEEAIANKLLHLRRLY